MDAILDVPILPARDLLHDLVDLLPGGAVSLINPLVYANAGALGHADYRRFQHWINVARDVAQPAVRLGRYGPDTYIDGSGPFHVLSEAALVAEHIAPGFPGLHHDYHHMLGQRKYAVDIATPCVLACHRGTQVWAHWLIDTLPKIVLAERAFPGRFAFVVPEAVTDPASSRFLVCSILESLAAYGIPQDRLLRLRAGAMVRFAALWDVIDLTGDGVHPGVLAAMRSIKTGRRSRGRTPVLASMRGAGNIRPVVNAPELAPVLRVHGAAMLDPGATPFLDKVQAFRDSDVIVADLGSNLATAIYASPGAGIVTVAPSNWRDNYFTQFFQRLGVCHADVRGLPLPKPGDERGHWAHVVEPSHLDAGIAAARNAAATPPGPGPLTVDGRVIARAPGPVILHIAFGARGNAAAFLRGGFSAPEPDGTWSQGPSCTLAVKGFGAQAAGDLWLEIKGNGFVAPPHLVSRELGVAVNGCDLARFDIDELTHVHVFVGRDVLAGADDMVITFHHPICPSPAAMGVSNDPRPLGFRFAFVALRGVRTQGT